MQVRQAIVSSPESRALKENKLVSRSEGIGDDLAETLCRWSPGLTGFGLGQNESFNFFQPDAETFALSRSISGLDHRHDDGRRVVSKIVMFEREQLRGYRNNMGLLFHILHSAGRMILQPTTTENLPLLDVPDRAFEELGALLRSEVKGQTERITHAVSLHRRVVVLGVQNSLSFLCSFLAFVPESERLAYSFATGLKVEDERPFTLQFFPESEPNLVKELASQQIRTISLDLDPVASF